MNGLVLRLSSLHLRPKNEPDPPLRISRALAATAAPLSQLLQPLKLDPLTVVDDSEFVSNLKKQPTLPDWAKIGLAKLYG